jgi:hypothetical protein
MTARPSFVLSLTLLVLLVAPAVRADDAQRAAGPALEEGQKHSGPKLTGAPLRACVRLDRDIDAVDTEVRILKGPVDAGAYAVKLWDERLDASLATLDNSDGAAVDRYNEMVGKHAQIVAEYNALLPAYNEVTARQRALVDRFNDDCAERAYLKKEWWAEDIRLHKEAAE